MVESHLLPTFKNQIRQKNLDFWLLLKKGFTIRHQAVEICGSERAAPLPHRRDRRLAFADDPSTNTQVAPVFLWFLYLLPKASLAGPDRWTGFEH